jgi:hypothetical protein
LVLSWRATRSMPWQSKPTHRCNGRPRNKETVEMGKS